MIGALPEFPGWQWKQCRWREGITMNNRLYYGDNLQVLREEIRDESVDRIYLDPPFNSSEGLLSGKERAQYPDMAYGAQTFKHAKAESKGRKTNQKQLF